MGFFASVNGTITAAADARVSVLDNGFVFGDGVYETLRTYGGRPFHLDRHLRRLRASAGRIGIDVPGTDAALAAHLDQLLARAGNDESFIRLIVSRGVGDISYHFDRVQGPSLVMVVKPFEPLPELARIQGLALAIVSIRRNAPQALDPAIKSCNLLNNILAIREAQAKGAAEAILLNQRGEVSEGASSNLFAVKGGALLTPPLDAGILAGITREVVLERALALGLPTREQVLRPEDLFSADEAFITSTLREIAPATRIDGRSIGDGRPGPISLKLLADFRAYAPGHSR